MINPKNNSVHPNSPNPQTPGSPSKSQVQPKRLDQSVSDTVQHHLEGLSLHSSENTDHVQSSAKTHGPDQSSARDSISLQFLADGNDPSQKIAKHASAFLSIVTDKQPKATDEEINQLKSTEPALFEILKELKSQVKSPLPPISALQTQAMISQVAIITAVAKIFSDEPDREKTHNFVTLINTCATVKHMVKQGESSDLTTLGCLDIQMKLQTLDQLIHGLKLESQLTPQPTLTTALCRTASNIITAKDLEQVRQYAQLVQNP